MAEEKKPKVKRKVRAEAYDPKVTFNGTLEDMIKMAANTKPPIKKEES
ncbi:hypothetical protein KXQ82_01005 [Mucilaginibacter sp. HMF5004]|nr:hypothetical protein [Mucilaginibacter rivuli]MBW4888267.1 hypothetical protein [Mucilaginibacter rivuli]